MMTPEQRDTRDRAIAGNFMIGMFVVCIVAMVTFLMVGAFQPGSVHYKSHAKLEDRLCR